MNILIFNGAQESTNLSTGGCITTCLTNQLEKAGLEVKVFNLQQEAIPAFDYHMAVPERVSRMCELFTSSSMQIWLSPLYHGGMPGMMKNCLDWLELTCKNEPPYLTDKIVALICWSQGIQAMQGINNMEAVAKALRAWILPYSIPVKKADIFAEDTRTLNPEFTERLNLMSGLIIEKAALFGLNK